MKILRMIERIAEKKWMPEALLSVSVISLYLPWINYIVSAVERGGGELRVALSLLLAVVPAALYALAILSSTVEHKRVTRIKTYSWLLLALFVAQLSIIAIAWVDVFALEITGALLRSYFFMIPTHSFLVLVVTFIAYLAGPRSKIYALRIGLALILMLFCILALGRVGSVLAT
ncbi:MAG: hypothetical protein ABIE25_04615 [Thermoplasmatota archaeon]|nr:hypothetical protein [Candidatus Thermoplasmatota archaeon]MBU1913569.1 hypothetical protein [Candidatus Thermoplasmatota archaeon]